MLERVWAWLHRTFPERQIYIRSDGRVQFFTFGPSLQATLAGLALIFLGWVAFATVNVIFKDRIIAAKDHRFQQMQSAYENRLADLQISYDELNGALVGAEDKFKATADALTAKQNAITGFLNRKTQVEAAIGAHGAGAAAARRQMCPAPARTTAASPATASASPAPTIPSDSEDDTGSSLSVMPGRSRPSRGSPSPINAEPAGQMPCDAGLRQHGRPPLFDSPRPAIAAVRSRAAYAQHPALQGAGRCRPRAWRRWATAETLLMAQDRRSR